MSRAQARLHASRQRLCEINLFTIADLSHVWLLCDLYENELGRVRPGDIATARLHAFPDRPLTAHVSNISRVLDPATRTAKVRLELSKRLQDIAEYMCHQGSTSLFELLDVRRNTQQALIAFNQARANYQLSLWQLEQAIGKPVF